MFQLGCPLWGRETSKQPNNFARDLPLHIKPDPHLPGAATQCTGNAEARVSQVVIIARKKNTYIMHIAQVHARTSFSLQNFCFSLLLELYISSLLRGKY